MNDFSSLDRLMELGMSMALANQMIGTMNYSLNNMQVPGQPGPRNNPSAPQNQAAPDAPVAQGGAPQQPAELAQYYAVVDGHVAGPMDDKQLSRLINAGSVTEQTLVWMPGLPAWKYAADVPAIYKIILLSL